MAVLGLFFLEAGFFLPFQWPSVAQLQSKIPYLLKSNNTQDFLSCSYPPPLQMRPWFSHYLAYLSPFPLAFQSLVERRFTLCCLHIFLKLTFQFLRAFLFTFILGFHKHQEQPVNLLCFLVHFHLGLSKTQNNYL